jgi:hypothetical protein
MTAKKIVPPIITEKGVLDADMKQLMTPAAVKELKDLSPTMQQFLLRWQDKRDIILGDQLKEELKEFLLEIHEKDNEELCGNIAEIVVAQNKRLISSLDTQTESIKEIQFNITKISKSVIDIQKDIGEIKSRIDAVEIRVSNEDFRILKLEQYVKPKWIIVRITITIIIAVLTTLLIHYWLAEPLHKIFIR